MKREWAARCSQSAERGAAAGPTGRINPVTGFPRSHLACDCLRDLLKPSPWGRMPQHVTVDKGFLSMPQLLFPSMPSATDPTLPGVTPGSLCSAHSPLDSCGQLLCEPRAEKHSSLGPREVRYVSISEGPQDTACGWRAFAPRCLQVFNTPKGLLFFLCVASFLQGMTVNGFINTVITSIERRFDLHSYQSGLIASSYDIAACLCLTFVSYFGGNGHKPRWLGWGVLVLGSGSLVFALPHFTAGRYEVEVDEGARTCPANQSVLCADSTSGLSRYRLVFMLGQFLHGMGATPLYTLGVTYLDENVKSSYSPVYIAIFYTAAILGPAAGYLVGGAMLNVYTELGQRADHGEPSVGWCLVDRFPGCWGCGLPHRHPYPRLPPAATRLPALRGHEGSRSTAERARPRGSEQPGPREDHPRPAPLYVAPPEEPRIHPALPGRGYRGHPHRRHVDVRTQVPRGSVQPECLRSCHLVWFKLRGSGTVRFCLLCTLISLLSFLVFLTHCPNVPVAGVTAGYGGSLLPRGHLNLTAACNAVCHCRPEHYSPVCGSDGTQYFSPCHAGCPAAETGPGGQKVYRGCSCVPPSVSVEPGHATEGKCPSACPSKPLLLALVFLVILFTFLSSIPALTATLRCVCDQQRSFALGIQWILVRTLGSIPGPIAFGWVIDRACLLWQDQCGQQGSCFVYQNAAMSQYMLIAGLTYKVLGFLFFAAACFLYKSPSGSSDGTEASLPSHSSASESPTEPQQQSNL
ncbi:solute carrier organic anion transporter family member 4A1 isoform X2 [Marmota monax]|uniref:solute carrier organic anion transporter family member 4A1 isoform X2 n=1 Tax=Marmota monax TaxID=9995 RepID=UPI001EAFC97C|nr:solute carrier organic anion transporter family member 4A1 isoform X2 [Marmota monax]